MVNCEQGPTAEPCGVCAQCVAIREGTHLDVVEIDAASHGGVEDARELREKAPTAPAHGPREGLHHRRGAAALARGVRRPAEGLRGAAARRAVRAGHHRAAQDAGHDRRPVPALRLPPARAWSTLAEQLQTIAEAEGAHAHASRPPHAIARQAEGSVARRALAARPGRASSAATRSTTTSSRRSSARPAARSSTSSPTRSRSATPAARSRSSNRLVQDGQDLRNVTAEALAHFREPAPGQDRAGPGRTSSTSRPTRTTQLRVQAEKFTPGRVARVIALLLAAQNDMRWTTSPAPVAGARLGPRHASRRPTPTPPASSPASNASNASPTWTWRRRWCR